MSVLFLIIGILLYGFLLWLTLGMLRIGAEADRQAEIAFERMLKKRKEDARGTTSEAAPAIHAG